MNKKFNLIILCIAFISLLSSCSEEPNKNIEEDDPEIAAIAFFDALYNEKNVEKAASVCSPKLARLIMHYRTPQAVARHLFNMSYDNVKIKPDDSGVKVREQFKGKANITVYFDGYYHDDRLKDVKRLAMVQIGDKWLIDKILKDPF